MTASRRQTPGPTWIGPFSSWDDAVSSREFGREPGSGSLFGLKSWLDRQEAFLLRVIKECGQPGAECTLGRASNLPVLAALSDVPLRILDLGGGSAWIAEHLYLMHLQIREYLVIDVPEVCERFARGRRSGISYANLDLAARQMLSGPWDIVYANSSMQYAPSNGFLLQLLQQTQPRVVLLDDLLTTPAEDDVFALQLNSDVPEVVRFSSETLLKRDLHALGYRAKWSAPFIQPGFLNRADSTDAAKLPELPQPRSLLFLRN